MTRELPKQPDRDPLTTGERTFLSGHDNGEFAYSAEDRTLLDSCCARGFLEPVEGEFLVEHIDATRIRLKPVYRFTEAGAAALSWTPPAEGAAP